MKLIFGLSEGLNFFFPKQNSENRSEHMYLERILGTSTKVNALNVLVNNPEKTFIEKELAQETGAAVSEINRQMPDLVQAGLVTLVRVGKGKVYSINKAHFLYKLLRKLFVDLNEVFFAAAKQIAAHAASKGARTVLLIGSVAIRKVRSDIVKAPSDIDLVLLVGNERQKEPLQREVISFVGKEISKAYGFMCYPVLMTTKEYLEALAKEDPFIVEVHGHGVELHGKKPRRFS